MLSIFISYSVPRPCSPHKYQDAIHNFLVVHISHPANFCHPVCDDPKVSMNAKAENVRKVGTTNSINAKAENVRQCVRWDKKNRHPRGVIFLKIKNNSRCADQSELSRFRPLRNKGRSLTNPWQSYSIIVGSDQSFYEHV